MKRLLSISCVILGLVFLFSGCGQSDKLQYKADMDLLIKSEVETAVSLLKAIDQRHLSGDINLDEAKDQLSHIEVD